MTAASVTQLLTRPSIQITLLTGATWGLLLVIYAPLLLFVPVLSAAAYGYGLGYEDASEEADRG